MRNESKQTTINDVLEGARELKSVRDKMRFTIKELLEQFVPAFITHINELRESCLPLEAQRKTLLAVYKEFSQNCGFPDARLESTAAFKALIERLVELVEVGLPCGHEFQGFRSLDSANECIICREVTQD